LYISSRHIIVSSMIRPFLNNPRGHDAGWILDRAPSSIALSRRKHVMAPDLGTALESSAQVYLRALVRQLSRHGPPCPLAQPKLTRKANFEAFCRMRTMETCLSVRALRRVRRSIPFAPQPTSPHICCSVFSPCSIDRPAAHVMTVGRSRPVNSRTLEIASASSTRGSSATATSISSASESSGRWYFSM